MVVLQLGETAAMPETVLRASISIFVSMTLSVFLIRRQAIFQLFSWQKKIFNEAASTPECIVLKSISTFATIFNFPAMCMISMIGRDILQPCSWQRYCIFLTRC